MHLLTSIDKQSGAWNGKEIGKTKKKNIKASSLKARTGQVFKSMCLYCWYALVQIQQHYVFFFFFRWNVLKFVAQKWGIVKIIEGGKNIKTS